MRLIASPNNGAMVSRRILPLGVVGFARIDGVGDDQFAELGGLDARRGAARQHAVGAIGIDVGRALLLQRGRGIAQGPGRIRRYRRPGCSSGPRRRR